MGGAYRPDLSGGMGARARSVHRPACARCRLDGRGRPRLPSLDLDRGGHVPRRVGVGRCDGPVGWLAEVAMHRPLCIGRKRGSSDRWIRRVGPKSLCRLQEELARLGLAFREPEAVGLIGYTAGAGRSPASSSADRGRELRRKTEGRGTRPERNKSRES